MTALRTPAWPAFDRAPQRYARLAGWAYLAIILLGACGELVVRGSLVVAGDAVATSARIAGSPLLWRSAIVGDLLMHLLDLPVIVVLYLLLRPVSRGLALLATGLNLVQTAVLAANKLLLVAPLSLLGASSALQAVPLAQRQALALVAIDLHGHGFAIGLLFFGVACLVRGALIAGSGYLPRWIGVLIVAAGASYLVNSIALLLVPTFASAIFPAVLLPALVGELSLCLWLIVRGVRPDRWPQPPAAPSADPRGMGRTP